MTPRLADFEGAWTLTRTIRDDLAGSTARFDGRAIFAPDANGLAYTETGTLTMDGQPPMQAERRYHWREDGTQIAIDFDDGRFFHSFAPDVPEATHWCDPDTYKVAYDFSEWPRWRATWNVSGPRKFYQMVSFYESLQI